MPHHPSAHQPGAFNTWSPQRHPGPLYNPHQHVQYPYSPQPIDAPSHPGRFSPYTGSLGPGHFGVGQSYPHASGPGGYSNGLQVNHTGMSDMSQPSFSSGLTDPHHLHTGLHTPSSSSRSHQNGFRSPHQTPFQPTPPFGSPHLGGPATSPRGYENHLGPGTRQQPQANYASQGPGPGLLTPMMTGMSGTSGMSHFSGMGAPHPGLNVHGGEQGKLGKADQIWITGEFFGVQRARDMLLGIAQQKVGFLTTCEIQRLTSQSKLVISRDTAILPRKLDWLLMERSEDVRNIMNNNATYIQVPSVGTPASLITVFGDHRTNIERTIRSLMALVSRPECVHSTLTC